MISRTVPASINGLATAHGSMHLVRVSYHRTPMAYPPRGAYRPPLSIHPARPVAIPASKGRRLGVGMALLASLWFVVVFEPQWWLAGRGITAGLKVPVLLFVSLGATLGLGLVFVKGWWQRWTWFPPLLTFIAIATVTGPFALNPLRARLSVQSMVLYWTLITGTIVLVDTARRAEKLLTVYALQFTLWGLIGARSGLVAWNTTLSNFDGYGAYVVIGGGLCAFMSMAVDRKWLKAVMVATVALCAIGVVSSFARGAFLAAVLVGFVVWLRSPRKGLTLGVGVACAVLGIVAASLLFGGAYWAEIKTIAQGTQEATGEDRWAMWQAAFQVFLQRPILGVGADNWGVFAAQFFKPGQLEGVYAGNPSMLYGRSTHSYYVQILAEHGIAGVAAFTWILVDFWKRNSFLRTPIASQRWRELGGRLKLYPVALGLEAAMVGWMGAAAVYSLAGSHWFYTILALNLLFHRLLCGPSATATRAARAAPARRGRPQLVGRPGPVGS